MSAFTDLQSWRITNDLRIANNKAAADAAYKKLLADNPGFSAVIPQLDELAGVYAAAVDA